MELESSRMTPNLDLYEELRFRAKCLAETILAVRAPAMRNPQVRYFVEQAELWKTIGTSSRPTDAGIAGAIFESLQAHITPFLSGRSSADELRSEIGRELGHTMWHRLNVMAPLGDYANSCAKFLIDNDLVSGTCLELGGGVGNLSRLIDRKPRHYIRTDKQEAFLGLPFGHEKSAYDFDEPGRWRDLDTIVAVNAVHCAADKGVTLRNLRDMLRPGGFLVLAEGQNEVAPGEPWCLNLVCGLYDGWWDRGGFLDRDQWLSLFEVVGFTDIDALPMLGGAYDFGGLLWARRPL